MGRSRVKGSTDRAFGIIGCKSGFADLYPEPKHGTIVEPFAGAAGYSLLYADRSVVLYDVSTVVVSVWSYLIQTPREKIMELPDLAEGQTVNDLDVSEGARNLIGWWIGGRSSSPAKTPSKWMRDRPKWFWGPERRAKLASLAEKVRHWNIRLIGKSEWHDVIDRFDGSPVTIFVDPPYCAKKHYSNGRRRIDYAALGERLRRVQDPTQVIVCEEPGAEWLPFRSLAGRSGEVVWKNRE